MLPGWSAEKVDGQYLMISPWAATERRETTTDPGGGGGVSLPDQLRWVGLCPLVPSVLRDAPETLCLRVDRGR